jgi:hypothetical protein
MSDDIRFRFRERRRQTNTSKREPKKTADSTSSIFGIWEEQKKLELEDKKLEQEIKEAKRKAKELKRTLYKNKFGDTKKAAKNTFEKLKAKIKKYTHTVTTFILKRKKLAGAFFLVVVAMFSLQLIFFGKEEPSATLGESTAQNQIQDDLPREKPDFNLLFPAGTSSDNYDVVRISPPEADASYTYLDKFTENGQIFNVTQQEVPNSFNLADTATDFQATNVIQVDDNQIFHGYSEKGGIQSVLFVKDEKLVLIRSPQRFNDDQWIAYYLSLN